MAAIAAPNPLGVHHETARVTTGDVGAHNMLVSFAYVVALAARGRERLSVLDWGGGLGHYEALARSVGARPRARVPREGDAGGVRAGPRGLVPR